MSNADQILKLAAERVERLAAPDLDPQPRRKLAVVACMDTRLDILPDLSVHRGDAHVIRNAGGLITEDVLRSLTISQHLLGTEEIVVVMHDDCGLLGASDEKFTQTLADNGATPRWSLGAFDDVEEALGLGLRRLRSAPTLLHRDRIRGFVFDPDNGTLREVEPLSSSRPAELIGTNRDQPAQSESRR